MQIATHTLCKQANGYSEMNCGKTIGYKKCSWPNRDILSGDSPIVLQAKPQAFVLEAANPRHEHDWELWKSHKLPEDKILVPGVISSTMNYIEHPEVVSQRILRYAGVVDRDRDIAGSDCDFGTFAGFGPIYPPFCWMKLRVLADGAEIASRNSGPHRVGELITLGIRVCQ